MGLAALKWALEAVFEVSLDFGLGPVFDGLEADLKNAILAEQEKDAEKIKREFNTLSRDDKWVVEHVQVARSLKKQFKSMQGKTGDFNKTDLLKWFSSNAVATDAKGEKKFSAIQAVRYYNVNGVEKRAPFVIIYSNIISKYVDLEEYFENIKEYFENTDKQKGGLWRQSDCEDSHISKRAAITLAAVASFAVTIVELVIFYVIADLAFRGLTGFAAGQLEPNPESIAKAVVNNSKTVEEIQQKQAQVQQSIDNKLKMFEVLEKDIFNLRDAMFSKTTSVGAFSNNFFDFTDYPFDMNVWNEFLKKVNYLDASAENDMLNHFLNGIRSKMIKYERMHMKIRKKTREFFMKLGPKTGTNIREHRNAIKFFDDGGNVLYLDIEKLPQAEKNALKQDFGTLHNFATALLDELEVFRKILAQAIPQVRLFSEGVMKRINVDIAGKQTSKEDIQTFDFFKSESFLENKPTTNKGPMQGISTNIPKRFPGRRREQAGRRIGNDINHMVEAFTYIESRLTELHQKLVNISGRDKPLYFRN